MVSGAAGYDVNLADIFDFFFGKSNGRQIKLSIL